VTEYEVIKQYMTSTLRQRQIVLAAKKLIIRHGGENITVKKIAEEIGITEGAIYRHFDSKTAIFSSLLTDVELSLVAKADSSLEKLAINSLEEMLMSQILSVKRRQGLSFQIIAEIISLGDKRLNGQAYEVIKKFIEQIKNVIKGGIKNGAIRPDVDVEAVSILVFCMIQGLATIWTLSHYKLDLEQKYQYLWNILRKSIIPEPS
jgi:TetR/AcrR family transcriptional regulator